MKKKKRTQKKKKKQPSILGRLLLFAVVLVAAYFIIIYFKKEPEPVTHSEHVPPRQQFIESDHPVMLSVYDWYTKDNLTLEEINQQLESPYQLIVLDKDINANRSPNFLLIAKEPSLPGLDESLKQAGYQYVFHSLVVYELRNRQLQPILTIDSNQITDAHGTQLIDQITAAYGYALVLEEWEHPALYRAPVQLIEIVMIDEQGREASDDITIYWDTSTEAYKATNTFGAP